MQKQFGFLAVSADNFDLSISNSVQNNTFKNLDVEFVTKYWSQIRDINDDIVDSIIINNNLLISNTEEISELVTDLNMIIDNIKNEYILE